MATLYRIDHDRTHPILEPIVQWGPFVMNTREEIEQAIADYQGGNLTRVGS